VAETRAAQERAAITAPTVHEEAARREEEKRAAERDHDELRAIIDARRRDRGAELGLREVGRPGFINAVERGGWVCVFIYEEVSNVTPVGY
jgi:hypothetical protein